MILFLIPAVIVQIYNDWKLKMNHLDILKVKEGSFTRCF